jgi:hypothetical protein
MGRSKDLLAKIPADGQLAIAIVDSDGDDLVVSRLDGDDAEAAEDTIDYNAPVAKTAVELPVWGQARQSRDADCSTLGKCHLVSHDYDISIG